MCGIVGYVGSRSAAPLLTAGLARLEYRGYDSSGIAVVGPSGDMSVVKTVGGSAALAEALAGLPARAASAIQDGSPGKGSAARSPGESVMDIHDVSPDAPALPGATGIGHTRWATHGAPSHANAHPHLDGSGRLALVHNGIIENHALLRTEVLAAGGVLAGESDSEVVAHLVGRAFETGPTAGDLAAALRAVCARLIGSFALVVAHADRPGELAAARLGSPLHLGIGDGEMFAASDVAAVIAHTRRFVEVHQGQVVAVTADGFEATTFDGAPARCRSFEVDWDITMAERGGHPTFMDKEIAEQPAAIADTLRGHVSGSRVELDELALSRGQLEAVRRIVVTGCGSAFHAGLIGRFALQRWLRVPVEVELASELRYRDAMIGGDTLVVAVSQSGETMDTLQAIRYARELGAPTLAICNTLGAQIPRECDGVLYTHAGPEMGVAATKTFLTQVAALHLMALALGQARGTLGEAEAAGALADLDEVPGAIARTLAALDPVRALGRELAEALAVIYLGRHIGYPVALEGALKLKELAYMHAEGFAAGELKHGPIALIEQGVPVVVVMPPPEHAELRAKMASNALEVAARGARVIAIGDDGDGLDPGAGATAVPLPRVAPLLTPLVATVPLQVLAAEIAGGRGLDIDRPRNLAKSVTVE